MQAHLMAHIANMNPYIEEACTADNFDPYKIAELAAIEKANAPAIAAAGWAGMKQYYTERYGNGKESE